MEKKKNDKKAVVILSGGLDSTTLLYHVIDKGYVPTAISFFYKQKHNKELEFAKKTCKELGLEHVIVDVSGLNDVAISSLTRDDIEVPHGHYEAVTMQATVVPNRNMVFLSLAASYAMSHHITNLFYGAHRGDHAVYPDCRPEFVKKMDDILHYSDYNLVDLYAPFIGMSKTDIVKRGIELKVPFENTWSCYEGKELACGKCGTCVERIESFTKNNKVDPIIYEK
jgi:7-cyano-7-deazaguanine synthase